MQLSHALYAWRIGRGHTRQLLAAKLGIEADALLCLENGVGLPTGAAAPLFQRLLMLMGQTDEERSLGEAIRHYLAADGPSTS
jgi:hypothetical protein